jgi:hypothetical protein
VRPIRGGGPIRAIVHGKKREHGPNSYNFDRDIPDLVRERHKRAVYCMQSWNAIRIGRDGVLTTGVLHAANWGVQGGGSHCVQYRHRNADRPGKTLCSAPQPRHTTLRAIRYRAVFTRLGLSGPTRSGSGSGSLGRTRKPACSSSS